jgi:plastocyanin
MRGTVTVVESGAPDEQPAQTRQPQSDAAASASGPAPGPAAGARTFFVDVANMKFGPADLTVEQGDAVTWRWTGADTNHSVTSDPGQPETFESHPGVGLAKLTKAPAGGTFTHTFTQLGSTTYYCRLHPDMKGTVRVVPRGAAARGAIAGLAPLRLSKMKVALQGRRLVLSLTSSVRARLAVQVWGRLPGARRATRLRTATLRARRGANRLTLTLPAKALRRGTRLRALVLGTDGAGNSARPSAKTLTVRR